jgi:cytochrome bd ubiquinol oxidase subunit I
MGILASAQLTPARWQMTLSLGSHIVLACFGVAFPAMIWVMHGRGLKGDAVALSLAKRWSKVAAVLFAVGAVSGTILSLEMGLLWPEFMRTFGDVIGLPFALEGIAFFIEAIFIGIYLFGWSRLPGRFHRALLIPITISGVFGTFCVLAVNAWMNAPTGFTLSTDSSGQLVTSNVDPLKAMFNRALWSEFIHMFIGAYVLVGFCVAAVYAAGLLKGRDDHYHRLGFIVPFAFASVAAIVQPVSGHVAGLRLATEQPSKLAAMELAADTDKPAPLTIGGIIVDGKVRYAIKIPEIGSLIARGGTDRPIIGLNDIPNDSRPNDQLATMVHYSFQGMVAIGTLLAFLAIAFWSFKRRKKDWLTSRLFLKLAIAAGPAAIVALELGWITTEVGRQAWIAYGVMSIEQAVTHSSGVWVSLSGLVIIYAAMTWGSFAVLRSMSRRWRAGESDDLPTPYGPQARRLDHFEQAGRGGSA